MPELPDVAVYVTKIAERIVGQTVTGVRLASPFFLRTFDPKPAELVGKKVLAVRRLQKRIVIHLEHSQAERGDATVGEADSSLEHSQAERGDATVGEADSSLEADLFAVIHLMIAGRFRWLDVDKKHAPAKIPGKLGLCAFDFGDAGSLIVTEASTQKRASLHLVRGEAAVAAFDRGGIDVQRASLAEFAAAVRSERHTMKRTLTDQTLLSGIGNAYSDEILLAAKLSPLQMSTNLTDDEMQRLHASTQKVLATWLARLGAEPGFPERVTAFREEMAAHGRYGKPCPVCNTPIQRIVYASNETNYCPTCQTGGKLLADRSMSRLLGADWPKNLEELENARPAAKLPANPERSTKAPRKPKPSRS